jgi:HK97 family phage major capsid protein
MPTLQDLVNEVNTVSHALQERVEQADIEQKKRHEELTSKTTTMAAEYKAQIDAANAKVDGLLEEIRQLQIAAKRPPSIDEAAERSKKARVAFIKAMKAHGKLDLLADDERKEIEYARMDQEKKTLYAGDATTGGFFASTDFVSELMQYILLISPVRSVARVQSTSGEKVQMPSLQGDASAYWATEQSSFADSNTPTLGMITIPVHEIRGLLKVSQQNLEDSMFNLEDLIRTRLGLRFAQTEGTAFVSGDGNGKPRGFMNYPFKASSSYSGGSAGKNNVYDAIPYVTSTGGTGKINADDVVSMLTDLKTMYAMNATWGFTRGTLGTLRLLKDSMNRPLWQPFAAANLPSTIYDRPYIELPDMDEVASGKYPIVIGDFSYYMIVDRISLNIQQLNELYIASGLIGFIARMRLGGDVLQPESFRVLKVN